MLSTVGLICLHSVRPKAKTALGRPMQSWHPENSGGTIWTHGTTCGDEPPPLHHHHTHHLPPPPLPPSVPTPHPFSSSPTPPPLSLYLPHLHKARIVFFVYKKISDCCNRKKLLDLCPTTLFRKRSMLVGFPSILYPRSFRHGELNALFFSPREELPFSTISFFFF